MQSASRRALVPIFGLTAGLLCVAPRAHADTVPIQLVQRAENRLIMDGLLGDWRRFTELVAVDDGSQALSGRNNWTGETDASMGFALVYDQNNLYVAAEVRDDTLVRSRQHRPNDDALIVTLAVPGTGNRFIATELVIYPGEPANFPGAVRRRPGGAVPGASVVEAPLRTGSGFTLEATIPWAALPAAIRSNIAAVRGRVAYQDADRASAPVVDTLMSSGPGDARRPAQLAPAMGSTASAQQDLFAQFLQAQGLSASDALLDRTVNLAGDAAVERVVVFGRHLFASGPGIASGSRYSFIELPTRTRNDVVDVAARDLNGDGRIDIAIRMRAEQNGLHREVVRVYGAPGGADSVVQMFAMEVRREQNGNEVLNRATYETGGRVRLTFDRATGFTQGTYPRASENNVVGPLLPWGANRVEVYRWDTATERFNLERADSNPNAAATAMNSNNAAPPLPNTPPTPMREVPADTTAVINAFRQARGLAADVRPSFSANANVSGDARPETLQVLSRYLVVAGPGFMNGRSYYNLELPVNADSDVLGLETGDVTNDGRAEVLLRVRRSNTAQVRGQPLEVSREYLLVYSLDDAHRGRLLAVEVSRRAGNDSITNTVSPPRPGTNAELSIDAGNARGWTQQSYPFNDQPMQGFAPLLLPWSSSRRVVYRWNGTALAPSP